jgi:tetratricopeptide (TPR) repeat protein
LAGAADAFRRAIALRPGEAGLRVNLGQTLEWGGNLDGAVSAYKEAVAVDPGSAMAHCSLGHALKKQGRLAEALDAYRRGHELGSRQLGWPWPSAQWVREAERLVQLDDRLYAWRAGKLRGAGAGELLPMVEICRMRKWNATAARLYAAAFAADPARGADPDTGEYRAAAHAAALAGLSRGDDVTGLSPDERAALRRQALGWLRADLAPLGRTAADSPARVLGAFHVWQTDPELAGLRDDATLAAFPPDEAAAWRQLWAEIVRTQSEAAAAYAGALRSRPDDTDRWKNAAPLLLYVGDAEGYRRHRREMLKRFADVDGILAERTAKACLLLPGTPGEVEAAARLAGRALRGGEPDWTRPYFQFAAGLADYRRGDFAAADRRMGETLSGPGAWNVVVPANLVRAMTRQHLGRATEARASLAQGLAILNETAPRLADAGNDWPDFLVCQLLRREAEELLH